MASELVENLAVQNHQPTHLQARKRPASKRPPKVKPSLTPEQADARHQTRLRSLEKARQVRATKAAERRAAKLFKPQHPLTVAVDVSMEGNKTVIEPISKDDIQEPALDGELHAGLNNGPTFRLYAYPEVLPYSNLFCEPSVYDNSEYTRPDLFDKPLNATKSPFEYTGAEIMKKNQWATNPSLAIKYDTNLLTKTSAWTAPLDKRKLNEYMRGNAKRPKSIQLGGPMDGLHSRNIFGQPSILRSNNMGIQRLIPVASDTPQQ